MHVLSIIEPYATLISEKKKFIETRNWKTNYRGVLYIHASITKPAKTSLENKELMALLENKKMNFGNIICKCNLVDCVYMTDEYVKNMEQNNHQEFICGEYSKGRYAWVLDDIEPITPLKAKGHLNIWNFYDEYEIMSLMKNIEYGWLDKNNTKHYGVDKTFFDNYILESPEEVIKNKVGVCWDQVELERYYFKNSNLTIKTYFIVYYDNDKCPTHTFLTYEKDGKFYWFEHSWERFKGIHEYRSQKELFQDVQQKFVKCEIDTKYIQDNLYIYEYTKPKSHFSVMDFYKHCEKGKEININGD